MFDIATAPHSNFRFHRWSRDDGAVLQRGYAERQSVPEIVHQLGRTVGSVRTRASAYGITRRKQTSLKQSAQPPQAHNWRDLTLLVTVGQRWTSYPKDNQDAFLERIGAVRRWKAPLPERTRSQRTPTGE
jgi:hypothetical protein